MNQLSSNVIQLVLIISTVLSSIQCSRKYDVYSESLKLYGEDLNLVLRRFRKSPEYLAILQTRIDKFIRNYEDTCIQFSVNSASVALVERVNRTFINLEGHNDQKSYRKTFYLSQIVNRAEEDPSTTTTTPSPVELLDSLITHPAKFSVAEINSFKDAGFEVAGDLIHKLIEAYGPEEETEVKSTKMPYGKFTTTTEHVQLHEVTSEPTEQAEPSSARFRASTKKLTTTAYYHSNSSFDKFHSMSDQRIKII